MWCKREEGGKNILLLVYPVSLKLPLVTSSEKATNTLSALTSAFNESPEAYFFIPNLYHLVYIIVMQECFSLLRTCSRYQWSIHFRQESEFHVWLPANKLPSVRGTSCGSDSKGGISRDRLLLQQHRSSGWFMINSVRIGSLDKNAREECGTSAVYWLI